jgi:predicted glycosyltransferase involved in capsule biosynthesis
MGRLKFFFWNFLSNDFCFVSLHDLALMHATKTQGEYKLMKVLNQKNLVLTLYKLFKNIAISSHNVICLNKAIAKLFDHGHLNGPCELVVKPEFSLLHVSLEFPQCHM